MLITLELLTSAAASHCRYQRYLDEEKARQGQLRRGEKCKALTEELTNLKAKRKCTQASIDAMTRSADQLSEEAEQTTPQAAMIAIGKSNAIRRSAKEKASQIEEVDREVLAKEKELKG